MSKRFTAEELAKLREIAEAATPGPWRISDDGPADRFVIASADREHIAETTQGGSFTNEDLANAHHLSTFDPPTVLALLDEIERLRKAAIDPGEYGIDEPVVDWNRTAELRAQEIDRLRRERETLAAAVMAMKYFFDSDYSDPEESATVNWSYAHQKWLEALALLDGERGGGGA